MMVGWPESSLEPLKIDLEKRGHTVLNVPGTGSALSELLERDCDALVCRACCPEVHELMSMSRSIRPSCRRVVTTLWGKLLGDSLTKLCDVDAVLSDSCTADELMAMLDIDVNQ
jgi:hypothetical protein